MRLGISLLEHRSVIGAVWLTVRVETVVRRGVIDREFGGES